MPIHYHWDTGIRQLNWLLYCCHRIGQNIGTMGKRKEGKWAYAEPYDYSPDDPMETFTVQRLAWYRIKMTRKGYEYNWYLKANREKFTSRFRVLEKKIRAMS